MESIRFDVVYLPNDEFKMLEAKVKGMELHLQATIDNLRRLGPIVDQLARAVDQQEQMIMKTLFGGNRRAAAQRAGLGRG